MTQKGVHTLCEILDTHYHTLPVCGNKGEHDSLCCCGGGGCRVCVEKLKDDNSCGGCSCDGTGLRTRREFGRRPYVAGLASWRERVWWHCVAAGADRTSRWWGRRGRGHEVKHPEM